MTQQSIVSKDKEQKDNEEYSKHFTRIPNMLFVSFKYLSKEEKFLYCTLKSVYWDAKPRFVSLRELSDMTSYSRGALGNMLPRLHKCGLIHAEIRKEKDSKGEEFGNPKYNITILDLWEINRQYYSCPPNGRDKLDPSLTLVHEKCQSCPPNGQDPVHEKCQECPFGGQTCPPNEPRSSTKRAKVVHQTSQGRPPNGQDNAVEEPVEAPDDTPKDFFKDLSKDFFKEEEGSLTSGSENPAANSKFPLLPSTDKNVEVEEATTEREKPPTLQEQLASMSPEVRAVVAEWQSCFEKPIALTRNTLKFAARLVARLIEPGEVKGCRDWKIENDENGYYAKHGMSLETIDTELDRYRSRSMPATGKSLLVEPDAEIHAVLAAEARPERGMTKEECDELARDMHFEHWALLIRATEITPGLYHLGVADGPGPRIDIGNREEWEHLEQEYVNAAIEYGLQVAGRQEVYA
jgi:hypothetical protein